MDYTNHLAPAFFIIILILHNNKPSQAKLSLDFYDVSCPNATSTIKEVVRAVIHADRRMAASLIRLKFHDCFVQGCDASILLNDGPFIKSEKHAFPNRDSVRGYDVIESAKSELEKLCPGVVSCADIVVLAARDSVEALGGPSWPVVLGRRDSTTANALQAIESIPGPGSSVHSLISTFRVQGLSIRDLVALSGVHTIGLAQCRFFRSRIHDHKANIDASFAITRKRDCPLVFNDWNKAALDVSTPGVFDNFYYKNLLVKKGLLHSDQVLMDIPSTRSIVIEYSNNTQKFRADFAEAMQKLARIGVLTGELGVIRKICRHRH